MREQSYVKVCSHWPTTTPTLVRWVWSTVVGNVGVGPLVAQWERTLIWPFVFRPICLRHLDILTKLGKECGGPDWSNVIFLNCTTSLHWTRNLLPRTRAHHIRLYVYWTWCAFHGVNKTNIVGRLSGENFAHWFHVAVIARTVFYWS